MTHYWIGVASREHVLGGQAGGFIQVCHGKCGPLKRMEAGDWIVYYSPTLRFQESVPCSKFTAIGQILEKDPYQFRMSDDFVPWRRDVRFYAAHEADIQPLIGQLTFIHDKQRWGVPFRRGCFAIDEADFHFIAANMGVPIAMKN